VELLDSCSDFMNASSRSRARHRGFRLSAMCDQKPVRVLRKPFRIQDMYKEWLTLLGGVVQAMYEWHGKIKDSATKSCWPMSCHINFQQTHSIGFHQLHLNHHFSSRFHYNGLILWPTVSVVVAWQMIVSGACRRHRKRPQLVQKTPRKSGVKMNS